MLKQQGPSSSPQGKSPWRVKLCRVLLRVLLALWGFLALTIAAGTLANLNATTTDTPLSKLFLVHLVQVFPIPVITSLGLLGLLTLLCWRANRWNVPARAVILLTTRDRERMLQHLRFRYEQMLSSSLQRAVQVELGLASRPATVHDAVSLSLRLPNRPDQLLPPHTSIAQAYEQVHQDVLILGEPGAGKSTLLLELAHHLVEQAEHHTAELLPVLLPLSSWATKKPPLSDWLIEQFAQLYDVPRKLSQQWIVAGQILPLLDGLDEMEEAARPDGIAAINAYHGEYLHPLVLSSQTHEYETASRQGQLSLRTAVVAQPLLPAHIDTHLETLGQPVSGLRTALRQNAALQKMATTPLMLQVLILAYHNISVRVLSQKASQLQTQIWTDFVERMVSCKGDLKRYPLEVTITWLSWLARQMREHNQAIFSIEQLQPNWLPKKQRILSRWTLVLVIVLTSMLVGALVGVLAIVLAIVLVNELVTMPVGGLLFGLIVVLVVGLIGGLLFGLDAALRHSTLRFFLWRSGCFPLRAVPFLEDATARILLRRVGGGYSFTHRLLQDYFADLDTQPPASPPSPLQAAPTPSAP